jgi:hypothetical protein
MTNWEHLNRFNNASLLRLNKRDLERFYNSVPNNNRWDNLHKRLRNALNKKRKTIRGLRMNKIDYQNILRRHRRGMEGASNRDVVRALAQINLINFELALRQKQLKRAAEKALSYGALNRIKHKRKTRNFLREELSLFPRSTTTGLLRPSRVRSRRINPLSNM